MEYSLDVDILKMLHVPHPVRPPFNPDAPLLDISGIWFLDLDRSESLEDYLTVMVSYQREFFMCNCSPFACIS